MQPAGQSLILRRAMRLPLVAPGRLVSSPRPWIYVLCTALALSVSWLLGKDMGWDTLDYHLYAGFSALHDRLGRDYFAAGAQSYLNPYVYAPFYLLVRSGLPALAVASILAVAQSAILWLTYELALAVVPASDSRVRLVVGACAALLAIANPILINQLGSSYADIITAELVLAGWLLLAQAVTEPSARRIVCAGALLGLASALKLTNALHALSACLLLPFVPAAWPRKLRLALGFGGAMALVFAAVTLPWALRMQHHFDNPFFPLLNNVFRSPQFPTTPMLDDRFVPNSLREALWRPFALALPVTFVDSQRPSPDLRYALLLAMVAVLAGSSLWRRWRRAPTPDDAGVSAGAGRALTALGCALLVDWTLWLRVSGNGRYFLAMACIAGVLAIALAFRALGGRPKILIYVLVAVFSVQGLQLGFGTGYRLHIAWDGGPWFEVSMPRALAHAPGLFFSLGEQSDSFIAPFLPRGSALVNLDGDYVLGPDGANGAHVAALIRHYAPEIRVLAPVGSFQIGPPAVPPDAAHVEDSLATFGLRADTSDCSTITVRDMRARWRTVLPAAAAPMSVAQIKARLRRVPQSTDGYLVSCRVIPDIGAREALAMAEREPDLAFDRMETECPRLFQPPRPVTQVYGDDRGGYLWIRKYESTAVTAVIGDGVLRFVDGTRGGRPEVLGSERAWAHGPVPIACGRHGEHYFARLLPPGR